MIKPLKRKAYLIKSLNQRWSQKCRSISIWRIVIRWIVVSRLLTYGLNLHTSSKEFYKLISKLHDDSANDNCPIDDFFFGKKAKIFLFLTLTVFTTLLPLTGAGKDLYYPSRGWRHSNSIQPVPIMWEYLKFSSFLSVIFTCSQTKHYYIATWPEFFS